MIESTFPNVREFMLYLDQLVKGRQRLRGTPVEEVVLDDLDARDKAHFEELKTLLDFYESRHQEPGRVTEIEFPTVQ